MESYPCGHAANRGRASGLTMPAPLLPRVEGVVLAAPALPMVVMVALRAAASRAAYNTV